MASKKIIIAIMLLMMLPMCGCWDKLELEQRAIIDNMVLDINEEKENEAPSDSPFSADQPSIIKATFSILIPRKVDQGGNIDYQRTVKGCDLPQAMQELGGETSRKPFYGQVRLLVLTENLLKKPDILKGILDNIQRRAEINQQMKVVAITSGGDKLQDVEPKMESSRAEQIKGILNNAKNLPDTIEVPLYRLIYNIRNTNGSAALPIIDTMPDGQTYRIEKVLLLKDYQFYKEMEKKHIATYKIDNGLYGTGRKYVMFKDKLIPFSIHNLSAKKKLDSSDGQLKYTVKVKMEGELEQYYFNDDMFSASILEEIEDAMEKSTEEQLELSTIYFQQDIQHDYLGFGDYTHKYHDDVYKKYKDNWDKAFGDAKITYDVEAKIRRVGTTKR